MTTEQTMHVHTYVSDRQTFEQMRSAQIEIGQTQRAFKQAFKKCQRDGTSFYTYTKSPNGYGRWIPASPAPSADPRLHNVAYALVRGKKYARIESLFKKADRDNGLGGAPSPSPVPRSRVTS